MRRASCGSWRPKSSRGLRIERRYVRREASTSACGYVESITSISLASTAIGLASGNLKRFQPAGGVEVQGEVLTASVKHAFGINTRGKLATIIFNSFDD